MTKKSWFLSLLLVSTVVGLFAQSNTLQPGSAVAEKFSPERLQRIDGLVKQYIDSGWIKGADAFIARNGKIVYYKAFGMADAEKNIPMKTDAIFRIASMSKPITSVAVMMLVEEGKIQLLDPVSHHLPEFKGVQVG